LEPAGTALNVNQKRRKNVENLPGRGVQRHIQEDGIMEQHFLQRGKHILRFQFVRLHAIIFLNYKCDGVLS